MKLMDTKKFKVLTGISIALILLVTAMAVDTALVYRSRNIDLHTYGWEFETVEGLALNIEQRGSELLVLKISSTMIINQNGQSLESPYNILPGNNSYFTGFPVLEDGVDPTTIFYSINENEIVEWLDQEDYPSFPLNITMGLNTRSQWVDEPVNLQVINTALVNAIGGDTSQFDRISSSEIPLSQVGDVVFSIEHVFNDGVQVKLSIINSSVFLEIKLLHRFTVTEDGFSMGFRQTDGFPEIEYYKSDTTTFDIQTYVNGVSEYVTGRN